MKILPVLLLSISTCFADTGTSEPTKFNQDRAAILQLAGSFKVDFAFQETLAIRKGYKLTKPYKTSAHELVKIVEDSGKSVTFQHLLVVQMKDEKPEVIKHWSQTWKYEDTNILKFAGQDKWETKILSKNDSAGTWSQFVTQIDDSPRYECYGTWQHRGGRSMWVSNEANRPLPRREYKKRKDYDIVVGFNTNVITGSGWAHEQHNAKLVKRADTAEEFIAHEIGTNTYTRTDDFDFTVATDYWEKYASYWAEVRGAWEDLYEEHQNIQLQQYVGNDKLREMIYELVETAAAQGEKGMPTIKERISQYLVK